MQADPAVDDQKPRDFTLHGSEGQSPLDFKLVVEGLWKYALYNETRICIFFLSVLEDDMEYELKQPDSALTG